MLNNRQLFYSYLAQTSEDPAAIEIERAEGLFLYGPDKKRYIDLIAGISVAGSGHRHQKVLEAINNQLDKYLHVMVYGEFILTPQVMLADKLTRLLPENLNNVYFTNSGAEAVEGALKLAKRFTGRHEIISFKNAYHGSTHGALSVTGNESLKQSFRPLLPSIKHLNFNNCVELDQISAKTACVIVEPIQGEAGCIPSSQEFMTKLRSRCSETGTLLILDEIQTGMGRTGKMFAFEHYEIIPDILLLAKSLGGGLPLGAFVSSKKIMHSLTNRPILGHLTTFGGNPVSCAAALGNLEVISEIGLIDSVSEKENLFREQLIHPKIKSIHGKGLLLAVEFENFQTNLNVIKQSAEKGLLSDWFLFADNCMRIAPPLIITDEIIIEACTIIKSCL